MQEDIKRLQDDVANLKGQLKSEQKPWYRKFSNWMSILAVALSLGITFINLQSDKSKTNLINMQALQKTIEHILELRNRHEDLVSRFDSEKQKLFEKEVIVNAEPRSNHKNIELKNLKKRKELLWKQENALNSNFGSLQKIYIETAETLIKSITIPIPATAYSTLAVEKTAGGNTSEAIDYALKAVEASTKPIKKAQNLRILAAIYYKEEADAKEGSRHFNDSIKILSPPNNNYMHYSRGNAFAEWSMFERRIGNFDEALRLAEEAKNDYLKLPDGSEKKDNRLKSINNDIAKMKAMIKQNNKLEKNAG